MQPTVIATSTDLLKALQTPEHPYYHSSQYEETYPNMAEFLDAWKTYDIDMNRIIRWDISDVKSDFSKPEDLDADDQRRFGEWGSQYVDLHFVAPRKGHTLTNRILNLKSGDIPRLYMFLKKHWEYTQKLWDPIPNIEYIPPTSPRTRFLDKIKAVVSQHTISPSADESFLCDKINAKIHTLTHNILDVLDKDYVVLEKPEDDALPLDASLNIAGELAKTYFDEINS